jgi:hypothetical protein
LIAAAPKLWLIVGSIIGLAAFNAELPAAREHMVRTDPGSLTAARVARTDGEGQSAAVAEARVLRYLPTLLTFALIADKLGDLRSAAIDR